MDCATKVLVVDGYQGILESVGALLQEGGCAVLTESDHARVFYLCQEQHFDVILINHGADMTTGIDVVRALKAKLVAERMPKAFFLMSGKSEFVEKGRQSGLFDRVFEKPFSVDELVEAIRPQMISQ